MTAFAKRVEAMDATATIVRKLFGAMTDPGTINFGGGAPAREALPMDIVREIAKDVLASDKRGFEALQYGNPMGMPALRETIIEHLLAPKGVNASIDNVMIVNGGIETMNLVCQLYIDPGDVILVERPTFIHCVEIFDMFEANCIACEMDDDGLIMEDVEQKIKQYHPKIVYTVPTFQNPTGRTLSLERRKKLAELGSKYDVMILEDDPYRDIRYSGVDLPPIKTFDKTGHTILANSLSKIFSPGSRLGYVVADSSIIRYMLNTQTATISHTGMISQVLVDEFFKRGYYPAHLEKICGVYRERRDVMMECLDTLFPAGTKHTCPDGGFFSWVQLPDYAHIDTTALLEEALAQKVAYVAGEGFFTQSGMGRDSMRLSFCAVEPARIRTGMKRLADLINTNL